MLDYLMASKRGRLALLIIALALFANMLLWLSLALTSPVSSTPVIPYPFSEVLTA